jgi:hypothetical protein
MTNQTLATGASLSESTWADFVARLRHDCVGEGVSRHYTRDALFVVEAKKYTYGMDEDYGAEKVACMEDTVYTSPADYYNALDEGDQADLDAECKEEHDKPFMELVTWDQWDVLDKQDGVTVTGRTEGWEYVNSHFTRDAADAFIARKQHDYRDGLRVNVEAQIYCWEFNAIKEAILAGRLQFVGETTK